MTDQEFEEFLRAVAEQHVTLPSAAHEPEGGYHLNRMVGEMSSAARLAWTVAYQTAGHPGLSELYPVLAKKLEHGSHIGEVRRQFYETGVLEALDVHADVIFNHLRSSSIPDEDLDLLRGAGDQNPSGTVTFAVTYNLGESSRREDLKPSAILSEAVERLKGASKELQLLAISRDTCRTRPRWFKGIAQIVSGGVAGAGNLVLGLGVASVGTITPAAVVASAALAVRLVGVGIGDLRCE